MKKYRNGLLPKDFENNAYITDRKEFHDKKIGKNNRTLNELKQDASDLYESSKKTPLRW